MLKGLVLGLVFGLILGYLIVAETTLGDRYEIIVNEDGNTTHLVNRRTGQSWFENTASEPDPDGKLITVRFWEEILAQEDARAITSNVRNQTQAATEALEQQTRREAEAMNQLTQNKLTEIYEICSDNQECINKQCYDASIEVGDPKWAVSCIEAFKEYLMNIVLYECQDDPACFERHCKKKHNNTYPQVSDCIREINHEMLKQKEALTPDAPTGEDDTTTQGFEIN